MTRAEIEGAILNVCASCAKLGKEIRLAEPARKTIPVKEIEEIAINPDFPKIIKGSRESKRLTREQLAKKIGEKTSVIERVEHGMKPDERLRRKLEHALSVNLSYKEADVKINPKKGDDYTLGDAVQIKIKKKKS